jgi:hypothetical protein
MTIGFSRFPFLNFTDALNSTLGTYIPTSIFWILMGQIVTGVRNGVDYFQRKHEKLFPVSACRSGRAID